MEAPYSSIKLPPWYLSHTRSPFTLVRLSQAKHKFEQLAREHGVTVKSYHAANSPFSNADFVRSIEDNGQAIKFSVMGAHNQNGVAERTIKTISSCSRTMLLHATIHWPE